MTGIALLSPSEGYDVRPFTSARAMTFTRYASLQGRTVVITGGASGIGAAFVRAFAENGARIAFLDLQEEAGAAIDQRYDFASITPEEFDRAVAVNFRHVFFASQAIVPQMRELGHGSIVNMSSVSWMRGIPLLEAYASAKAAIVGFTNTLARAVGPHRIRANAIAPGMVLTDRQRRLWFEDASLIEVGRAQQCLPDLIAPEDIANLALFLAADDSRLITRQCISVNGGVL